MNVRKKFKKNSFYHIYNRGINKTPIFLCEGDYEYFINLIKKLLSPYLEIHNPEKNTIEKLPNTKYMGHEIELYSYCLMPNHFHLLIKQISKRAMTKFMRRLMTSYVMHFNKKYGRSGRLFERTYCAVPIKSQKQLKNIISYIHENPAEITNELDNYTWSSRKDYIGKTNKNWLHKP